MKTFSKKIISTLVVACLLFAHAPWVQASQDNMTSTIENSSIFVDVPTNNAFEMIGSTLPKSQSDIDLNLKTTSGLTTMEEASTYSCEMDDIGYDNLEDALLAIKPSETKTIALLQDISYPSSIKIENGSKITFDLNGHMLNVSNATGIGLKVTSGSVDFIGDGQFNVSGKEYGIFAQGKQANATVSHVIGMETGVVSSLGGTVTVKGNSQGGKVGIHAEFGSTIHVEGNVIATESGSNAVYARDFNNVITVQGDVSATGIASSGITALDGGDISIIGNVEGSFYGVFANGVNRITIVGDVKANNLSAVHASDSRTSITIMKDVKAKDLGVFADSGAKVIVKHDVISENSGVKVTLMGTLVTVEGDITSTGMNGTAIHASFGGEVIVYGTASGARAGIVATDVHSKVTANNAIATSALGIGASVNKQAQAIITNDATGGSNGVSAENGGTITVGGNVTSTEKNDTPGSIGYAVHVTGASKITIDGAIASASVDRYIRFGSIAKTEAEQTIPTSIPGYRTYTDDIGIVWVKSNLVCEIDGIGYAGLEEALVNVGHNGTIKLLKNIDYNKAIFIKNKRVDFDLNGFILNVTNNSGAGLEVDHGTVIAKGTGEMNVTGTTHGLRVYGNQSIVNITSATATGDESNPGFGVSAFGVGTMVTVKGKVNSNGEGIYASSNASVLVEGDVTAGDRGVHAYAQAEIIVRGKVVVNKPGSIGVSISDKGSIIVDGTISAEFCSAKISNGGTILAKKNLIATGPQGMGASIHGSGNITIYGTISAVNFIELSRTLIKQADGIQDDTKPGYVLYSDGDDRKVWVKGTLAPESYAITTQTDGNGIATANPVVGQLGTEIILTVTANVGYHFLTWEVIAPATLVIANGKFVMPNEHVIIKAIFEKDNSSGGTPGGSRPANKPILTPIIAPTLDLAMPINIDIAATVDSKGIASIVIPNQTLAEHIKTALASEIQTTPTNPMTIKVNIQLPDQVTSQRILLSQIVLQQLLDHKIQSLELNSTMSSLVLNQFALQEFKKKTDSDIIFTLVANTMTSNQPTIRIDLQASKDGKPIVLQALEQGTMIVRIPYTAKKEEDIGHLFGQHIDSQGIATRILQSLYHRNHVIFTTKLFSTFGVGYATPTTKPTDTITHFAKDSIDLALSRGWMDSLTLSTFSDTAITREQLVVALGKLAGIDVNQSKDNGFGDVKKDNKALPYMEWANQTGIVSTEGINQFHQSSSVSREDMALMVAKYAKTMGILLPRLRTKMVFQDQEKISMHALSAVQTLQQAGILMGKQNQMFHPLANVTRAEFATILHRLVSLTTDSATIQGWAKNDDGQMFYYLDGKAITGLQTIASFKYYFDTNGIMQTGWKYDESNKRLYLTSQGASTGWSLIDGKTYHFSNEGFMSMNTWLEIDKQWYYFYSNGTLAINATIGIYQVDGNGVRKTK